MVKYFCDACGRETQSLSPVKLGINWVNTSGLCKDPLQLDGGQCCPECATSFAVLADGCRLKVFAGVQSWLAGQLIAWKKGREKMVVGVDLAAPGTERRAESLCVVCDGKEGDRIQTPLGGVVLVCQKHLGYDFSKPLGSMAERTAPAFG